MTKQELAIFREGTLKEAKASGDKFSIDISSYISNDSYVVLPGFVDVHVHLREPGFSYKETIATGTAAALAGGYSTVCPMPNLNPVPDSLDTLKVQLDLIKKDALVNVIPYGAITLGESGNVLSDMEAMAPFVCAFSDDGRGVQNGAIMKEAMIKARSLGKIIAAHCEDNSLLNGGYIHDGKYAAEHGHKGICSESEWGQIERDLALAEETGCAYHICHVSTKESVALIRAAKARGVNVTCETAPHYLILDESCLQEDARFKMNPPLRETADREALIEGIIDGTVDMIATDHAPHSAEEKARGLKDSPMGVVGLETAFPLLYTYLVRENIITLDKLIELMCINPSERFGIPLNTKSFCVWDLNTSYIINPETFKTKGRSTPFAGMKVFGQLIYNNMEKKNG
ncbi:MAG: dihydroorotase [Parasporobacterium sp.]|nr:dihydroorotase [Parasporobacterium sp.]